MFKCQFEEWNKGNVKCLSFLSDFCITTVLKRLPAQTSISTIFPVESIVSMRKWLLIVRHIGIFKLVIADCCHTERLFYNKIHSSQLSQFCGHLSGALKLNIHYAMVDRGLKTFVLTHK